MTTPAETAQATTAILESGAIMLGAALIFVTLFRRLKLGATLGYIVAGALIGPQLLRLIRDPEQLTSVTEIGIALLLFIVGLELQPSRLWRMRKDIFGLGLAQVVLCGVAISGLLYFALGLTPEAALAIGLPLGLSSTAQVLPMLRADNELNTPQGERAFSILLFQDLAIVPMITIIAAMARVAPDPAAPTGWKLALYTLLAVIGLVAAIPRIDIHAGHLRPRRERDPVEVHMLADVEARQADIGIEARHLERDLVLARRIAVQRDMDVAIGVIAVVAHVHPSVAGGKGEKAEQGKGDRAHRRNPFVRLDTSMCIAHAIRMCFDA